MFHQWSKLNIRIKGITKKTWIYRLIITFIPIEKIHTFDENSKNLRILRLTQLMRIFFLFQSFLLRQLKQQKNVWNPSSKYSFMWKYWRKFIFSNAKVSLEDQNLRASKSKLCQKLTKKKWLMKVLKPIWKKSERYSRGIKTGRAWNYNNKL